VFFVELAGLWRGDFLLPPPCHLDPVVEVFAGAITLEQQVPICGITLSLHSTFKRLTLQIGGRWISRIL
jgi:hypothetical protein